MEIVERYLHTVKTFLPASQKSDIVAELDENIRSEIEEREAELGHPLVIFFDDLQWADQASLSLIKTLLTDAQTRSGSGFKILTSS